MRRPLRSRPYAWLLALGLTSAASSVAAAPKDEQAEAAAKAALEEDYLQTDFEAAQKRLIKAIRKCGKSGCSPKVEAKLHVAMGTVLAGGMNELDDARDAFVQALELDPNLQPDPDFVKSEITFAYEEARKQLKLGAPKAGGSDGGIVHTPVDEQQVNTPIPIQIELGDDVEGNIEKVVLRYRGPSSGGKRRITLKMIDGTTYRGQIPCIAVEKVGELEYWIEVLDDGGEIVATAGDKDAPLVTEIKDELDGEPPSWPGMKPPKSCGGESKGAGSGRQCVDDSDCSGDATCTDGACQGGSDDEDDEDDGTDEIRRNWITLSFSPDLSMVSGDDVCSKAGQDDDHWVCAREDGSRYVGTPTPGQANNVNTGFGLSTMRVALAYDRLIGDNLTLGLKAGFAFRGTTEADASFLPVHAEGRATYFFGSEPFASTGARPFVQLAGGLMQVDTPVDVEVVEDGEVCGADSDDLDSPCTEPSADGIVEKRVQTLTAHKQAGQGFAGLGFGLSYAPAEMLALNLGLRVSVTLPVTTLVLSPEAGVALGF